MFLKRIPINFYFLFSSLFYYLLFINKGIVIYDEGYYAHIADRIISGQIPYKDFFVQFTPGYFYLLALFYKLLGSSVITGRILTLIICMGIVYFSLKLIDKYILDLRLKLIAFSAVVSFGFPLINNMSLLAWPSVLLTILIVLLFTEKKYIFLGLTLSLLLFTKQNLGIYFFILTNFFLIISKTKVKNILLTNFSFFILTLVWFIYFFLILNRIGQFWELLGFNTRYLSIYHFSYPPLGFLLQPTGIFKLLPYYAPIVFGLFLIKQFCNKKINLNILYFSAISLVGFFGTLYPTSDLLHIYPFLGLIILSSVIVFNEKHFSIHWKSAVLIITGVLIGIGFYLTLFKEYYRYQPEYRYQKVKLDLPRAQNIYIDQPLAINLATLNLFFLMNTKKSDSILCYPFCPMIYFILERNNPSQFSNYYPGYLNQAQEKNVIKELKMSKVKYIVTFLNYKFDTPISNFIQKQKEVYKAGQFKIFQIY